MLRQVGIRTLFLLGSLGALAIAVGFALYAAPELIRSHLSGDVSDRTLEEAVAAARQAILLGGALAAAAAVLFSFGLGTAVAQAMRRVRYAAVRVLDAPSRRSMPSFALLELDMLAGTLGRIASDLDRRLRGIRRERDEATRLLDSVGEGILQLTEDGRIVRVNRTAIELLGLPEDQEVRERPVVSFVRHPALREMLTRAAAGDAVPSREVRLDDRRVLVLANPLRGGTGRAGAVAVFVDLTELRRLEGVRRDFVANASHELKTPLTSLRGYSETLLQDDVPEELRRQFLESIHHNADRLHRIVEDLLDLSRLESGRWEPDYEPVDPAAVAEDVWHGFAERAEAAGVAFDVERDYDDPVPADRVALAQIFSNLYDNALRHTPEGGRIRVRVARADRADVHATAAIAGRVDPAA
ncbi:MAG: sensor histidine kinase, partial [Gemmatimonadota bacterium]